MQISFRISFFIILFLFLGAESSAQNIIRMEGKIEDQSGSPLEGVKIAVPILNKSFYSDAKGFYTFDITSYQAFEIEISLKGKQTENVYVEPAKSKEIPKVKLFNTLEKKDIDITKKREREKIMLQQINPEDFYAQPTPSGDIKGILEKLPGVSSNNELSTQYNVRGGNYDENLVYINDIEIFRPLLVRSGQQEGLSIINPSLVKNLNFSAGGFGARYGDKLSSVLDIQYKRPDSFRTQISASFLGVGISFEGTNQNHRFRFLGGARYRTNQYLLGTLDVKGQYLPKFADFQSLISYDIRDNLEVSLFSYYGSNSYQSIPESQQTSFGTVSQTYQLNIDFAGKDIIKYSTLLNGLTLKYSPDFKTTFKWINSLYFNDEREEFDIIAQYRLDELENDPGSENFGKSKGTLGYGGYLNHARNKLQYYIMNSEVKGEFELKKKVFLETGLKFQREDILDKLREYRYIDSADYSVPDIDTGKTNGYLFPMKELIRGENKLAWNRYSGYVHFEIPFYEQYNGKLIAGVRGNYWDYNKEFIVSPRFQFVIQPNSRFNRLLITNQELSDSIILKKLKRNYTYKIAIGSYNQPPFYRELRQFSGQLNPLIRAQKSWQFSTGTDVELQLWKRPFKFTAEAYFKYLYDVIPYEIENVRIRYYATNNAKAYATGLDLMLNGELVKDNPSYISLSFLKTGEDVKGDEYLRYNTKTGERDKITPGYIPRPADQRVRFALFFQDFLPKHPSYKAHLSLIYGTGLPFGPPDFNRYKDTLRMPAYRRVDIGFSRLLYDRTKSRKTGFVKNFRTIWASLEIFNTFNINNTISYLWVQDVGGAQWGIPNYLTGRRVNFHLEIKL